MKHSPDNPFWKGPFEDGVSQSLIHKFQQCPYRFYLYAILGLQESKPLNENLIWGDCFHKGLEHYLPTFNLNNALTEMVKHLHEKYPYAPPTYETSLRRMLINYLDSISEQTSKARWITEHQFDTVTTYRNTQFRMRGKIDGFTLDHPDYGKCMIEHKCKGYIDAEQTKMELPDNLQLNYYLPIINTEWVLYDLIQIPESLGKYMPKPNYNEAPSSYMERLFTGPCGNYNKFPINSNKHFWIRQVPKQLPHEQQEEYFDKTIGPYLLRLHQWYQWVTQSGFDPDNPKYYNELFYKVPVRMFNGSNTEKFECEYYNYLTGQETLDDLIPAHSMFGELEEQ